MQSWIDRKFYKALALTHLQRELRWCFNNRSVLFLLTVECAQTVAAVVERAPATAARTLDALPTQPANMHFSGKKVNRIFFRRTVYVLTTILISSNQYIE